MKYLLFYLVSFLFASAIYGQQGTRVGVIDTDMVIRESVAGKAFFKDYQVFIDSKRNELQKQAEILEQCQKDMQAKAHLLNEIQMQEKQVEFEEMQKRLKYRQEDAEREAQARLNSKLEEMQRALVPIIRQVAIDNTIQIVLNNGTQSGVVYFSETVNITEFVIAMYNAQQ
jgi:outer membrane protein